MLTYLELENFRAFKERVHIDIRPITVLIGKNSSGKSSVLKFLQMLRQSVGQTEAPFFRTEGVHAALGAWQDLKNKSEPDASYLRYEIGLSLPAPQLAFTMNILKARSKAKESGGKNIAVAGVPRLRYRIAGERSYFADGVRGKVDVEVLDAGGQIYRRDKGTLGENAFLSFPLTNSAEGEKTGLQMLSDQVFLSPVRKFFSELHHLGPVRQESERMVQAASLPDGDVGHKGEHTLANLVRLIGNEKAKASLNLVLEHAANILHLDKMTLKDAIPGLYARFEARNADTHAEHWLADFGFGVGQCLPILVQGALLGGHDILTIEQPEAQLHPTAQLELGSFFKDMWKKRGVSSIIETHSSNILLRLRKHVRAGDLKAEDVNVAYFDVENGVTKVTNLGVKPDGELDGHLPMEFFGADVFEALEFNALQPPKPSPNNHG